jgi:hypothetical protein
LITTPPTIVAPPISHLLLGALRNAYAQEAIGEGQVTGKGSGNRPSNKKRDTAFSNNIGFA